MQNVRTLHLQPVFLLLTLLLAVLPASGQQKNPSGSAPDPLSEDIIEQQRRLRDQVQAYIGTQNKESIVFVLELGRHASSGERDTYVYIREARISLSQGVPQSLEFYYSETHEKSLIKEEQKLQNSDLRNENLGEIKVTYDSTEAESRNYAVKELKSKASQLDILRKYRDNLIKTNRRLESVLAKRRENERLDIKRILNLGELRN